jgi:membrane protease YdiL (CAAX protease family)
MDATTGTATPPAVDDVRVTYDHALGGGRGWWRGALAIVLLVVGYFLSALVVGGIGVFVDVLLGNVTLEELTGGAVPLTPWIFLTNNIALALMIPLSFGLQRWLFGVRPGTLSSVVGRFRWGMLGRLAVVLVPVFALYGFGTVLLTPALEWSVDGTALFMLAAVLLTTPLQAAGEEYGARGLLQRAGASWAASPTVALIVGTLVSGVLFCIAHGAGDPWLIGYYFLFGVAMTFAARGTGGLEAPVLIHALNNTMLFIPSILTGQLDEGIDRSEGAGGPWILLPSLIIIAAAAFTVWRARRTRAETRSPRLRVLLEQRTAQQWREWEQWRAQQRAVEQAQTAPPADDAPRG